MDQGRLTCTEINESSNKVCIISTHDDNLIMRRRRRTTTTRRRMMKNKTDISILLPSLLLVLNGITISYNIFYIFGCTKRFFTVFNPCLPLEYRPNLKPTCPLKPRAKHRIQVYKIYNRNKSTLS